MGNLRELHLGERWREYNSGTLHHGSPIRRLILFPSIPQHGCGWSSRYLPSSSYAARSAGYSEAIRRSAMWLD
jgi:hypothetical protein